MSRLITITAIATASLIGAYTNSSTAAQRDEAVYGAAEACIGPARWNY